MSAAWAIPKSKVTLPALVPTATVCSSTSGWSCMRATFMNVRCAKEDGESQRHQQQEETEHHRQQHQEQHQKQQQQQE